MLRTLQIIIIKAPFSSQKIMLTSKLIETT